VGEAGLGLLEEGGCVVPAFVPALGVVGGAVPCGVSVRDACCPGGVGLGAGGVVRVTVFA